MRDVHFHIAEPHALMPEEGFNAPTLDNAAYILRAMEAYGLEQVCVPSISLFDPVDFASNPLALYCKTLAPGRVFALGGLRYGLKREENADLRAQAETLLAAGFDGFKMICKPNARRTLRFPVDDPLFDDFFAFAEETGAPILYHVGDPETFWDDRAPEWAREFGWYYGDDEGVPSMRDMWDETERMLEKHPRLRVTFAHFFFLSEDLPRAQRLFDRFPNVSLDLTPGGEMFFGFVKDRDASRAFFEKNSQRLLFGTDNSASHGGDAGEAIRLGGEHIARIRAFYETDRASSWYPEGIKLSDQTLQNIFSDNFTRFLGAAPKPVDRAAAAALCRALAPTAARAGAYREGLEALYGALTRAFEV